MLTLLEEVVLLAVDENTGQLKSALGCGTSYALAGAVLFDLALAGKIDTDTEELTVTDSAPIGDATSDRILTAMQSRTDLTTVRQWVEELVRRHGDLEGVALQSLIARGILRHERTRRLWIIDIERFPLVQSKPQRHVKDRLSQAILRDEIPDTRDIMLVSLVSACGLLGLVLGDGALSLRRERIDTLCGLETISRKIIAAIRSLEAALYHPVTRII